MFQTLEVSRSNGHFNRKRVLHQNTSPEKEHMQTYARLEINEAQGHKDPSDHVIIAHAITEHLPLISSDTRFEFYRTQGLDLIFNKK